MDFDLDHLVLLFRDDHKVGPVYIKLFRIISVHVWGFRISAMTGDMINDYILSHLDIVK